MSIFSFPLLDSIKDRIFEYFLKKYLGEFLLDSNSLKSSKLSISDGKLCGHITNLQLDCEALNGRFSNTQYIPDDGGQAGSTLDPNQSGVSVDGGANLNLPIIFTQHAEIRSIEAVVPWTKLLTENSVVKIDGTRFEIRLNLPETLSEKDIDEFMASSMDFNLMSPSIQIAEDLIENVQLQENRPGQRKQENRLEGLEMLANVIESVLRRIELTLTNTSIIFVDEQNSIKLEFRIRSAIWCKDDSDDDDDQRDELASNHSGDEGEDERDKSSAELLTDKKVEDDNFSRTVQIIGLEVLLDSKSICKMDAKHTIRLNFGKSKSIHIFFSTLFYTVLTPAQFRSILKVFAPPNNSLLINPHLIDFKDLLNQKLITEDDYHKIEEQIQVEKMGTPSKYNMSNSLKFNQSWTSGFKHREKLEDQFYPFITDRQNIHPVEASLTESTKNAAIDIFIELPGIVFCLLSNDSEQPKEAIEALTPEFGGDFDSIARHLDERLANRDHLRFCALNLEMFIRKEMITCNLANFILSECSRTNFEHLLFSETVDSRCSLLNYEIQYCFKTEQMVVNSNVPTFANVDVTIIERLESYLKVDERTSVFDLTDLPPEIDQTDTICLDRSKLNKTMDEDESEGESDERQFELVINFSNLNGRLFFPVPVFTDCETKSMSQVRDETMEFVAKNSKLRTNSKGLNVTADFLSLFINENYSQFKRQHEIKYLGNGLLHMNHDLSISDQQILDNTRKEEICQFRSLNNSNRIELKIVFSGCSTDIFLDNPNFRQQTKKKPTVFFSDNIEDSIYINNCFNLDSMKFTEFQTKRRIVKEKQDVEEILAPNNRQQSTDYLNAASLVSEMVIQLYVPQMIGILTTKDQLNFIYNRFVNDFALWKPFNFYPKQSNSSIFTNSPPTSTPPPPTSHSRSSKSSTRNVLNPDHDFIQFDQNIGNLIQSQSRDTQSIMECSTAFVDDWDPNINIADFSDKDDDFHHFEISDVPKHTIPKPRTSSLHRMKTSPSGVSDKFKPSPYFMCKSGLEESTDSEVSFHSIADTSVDKQPRHQFANTMTFIMKIKEAVLNYSVAGNEDYPTQSDQYSETQSLIGNNLLIGCVLSMAEFDNANRLFIHGEEMNLCINNLSPVTRLQAYCAQNQQFFLLTANRLLNNSRNCKLNAGFEIVFESETVKKIKIAIQLVDGLLMQINVDQFAKFWDFVNVTDDEIEGYIPAKVLTELHVNLVNTAIDIQHECVCNNLNHGFMVDSDPELRSNSLPNCHDCEHPSQLVNRPALFVCEDVSITCIILEASQHTLLRFIFEETALFFAKKMVDYGDLEIVGAIDQRAQAKPIDNFMKYTNVKNSLLPNLLQLDNYVCAINCDLLEFNLKISKGSIAEIKINNNLINIRGCSDLLAALSCFSQRFTSSSPSSSSPPPPPSSQPPPTTSTPSTIDEQSSCHQHPHGSPKSESDNPPKYAEAIKPIYDEKMLEDEEDGRGSSERAQKCKCDSPKLSSKKTNRHKKDSLEDSSFFILGDDDFGTGIKKSPEPEIRLLTNEPIVLKENFYALPKQTSTPLFTEENLSRFLLDEMSICLHLFGGRDFVEDFGNISGKDGGAKSKDFETPTHRKKSGVYFSETIGRFDQKIKFGSDKRKRYSRFDLVAMNFGRSLEFYANTGFSGKDCKNLNQVLWEDLDLVYSEGKEQDNHDQMPKTISMSAAKTTGGFNRNASLYVKMYALKLRCLFDRYIESNPINWRFLFAVNELEIRDCVKNSQINKMLYEYISEKLPKRSNNMVTISATTYRNLISDKTIDQSGHILDRSESVTGLNDGIASAAGRKMYDLTRDECDLKISLKPLRINIDQDTIMFLIEYFNQLSLYLENSSIENPHLDANFEDTLLDTQSTDMSEETGSADDDRYDTSSIRSSNSTSTSYSSGKDLNRRPLFIKSFIFSPDVPIKLDYQGKRVDFDQGPIAGILIGLGQLNQSELTLKRIHYKYGILGFEKVFLHALNCWIQDIKKHQLPSILGGVGPVHSFVQLFQGIRDLFWLPIDQYRRDKRIVRGLQRGLFSFSTCSTIALLELTNKTLSLIEFTAQSAHDFMTGNSLRRERMLSVQYEKSLRLQQPRDVREGALSAYNVISQGFYQAFRNLTVGRSRNNSSAIGHIIRELPANVLLPIIHSSQATSNMLLGVRNQMTPQARKEDEDKWKS